MLAKLLAEFVDYLRNNDIHVPTSSVKEAFELLPYINIKERTEFQKTIQQIWIKDVAQYEKYDIAFEEFFFKQIKDRLTKMEQRQLTEKINSTFEKLKQKQEERDKQANKEKDTNEQLKKMLATQKNTTTKKVMRMVLSYEIGRGLENIKDIMADVTEDDIDDLAADLTWDAIENDKPSIVFDAIERLRTETISLQKEVLKIKTQELNFLSKHEKEVHKGMRQMVQTEVDQLMDKEIKKLNKTEIIKIREAVERNSVHLMTKFSKLLRQTNKEDEIDMRKTISDSMKTFGIPIRLYYKSRKTKKTKIDIILDVSGSMKKAAEFLTLFAYLLHKQFPGQVRVFTFVGILDDSTHLLQFANVEQVINDVLSLAKVDYRGYSDYQKAFEIYKNQYLSNVDEDTIVFILGDARNNKNASNKEVVKMMSETAKSVFWFNPEDKEKWNNGDSVISKYATYCKGVYETKTVKELLNALENVTQSFADIQVVG